MRINGIVVESLRCYGGYLLVSGICRCGFIEIEILGESMGVEVIDVVLDGEIIGISVVDLRCGDYFRLRGWIKSIKERLMGYI